MNDTDIKCHRISKKEETTVDGKRNLSQGFKSSTKWPQKKDNLNLARENEGVYFRQ